MIRNGRHGRTFVVAFVLFFLASTAWAITTPLAGSPDEPAHIVRAAAVAHGQLLPDGQDAEGRGYFRVPASLGDARGWEDCFAHDAEQGAACQPRFPALPGLARESTSASAYNPLYYSIVGWPSLFIDDPYPMVYSMRLITAAVNSLLLAAAFVFLSTIMRPGRAAVVMGATATPMLFFLGGAVNPNAWEITGGMALLCAVLSIGHRPDRDAPTWPALVVIAVSGALVANLRGISPLWVVVLGVIGLIAIAGPPLRQLARRPGMWIALAVVALGFVAAVTWGLIAGAFALEGNYDNKEWSPLRVVDFMLRRTVFEHAYVGLFGWTDTAAPLITVVILGGIGIGLIASAFWLGRGRMLALTCAAMIVWLAAPALIQLWYVRSAGMIWQGRYTMVMYTAVVILAAVAVNAKTRNVQVAQSRRLSVVLGGLVVFAHGYVFAFTQMRYAEGTDATLLGSLLSPSWSPPGSALVWLVLTCAACAIFAYATADVRAAAAAEEAQPSDHLTKEHT